MEIINNNYNPAGGPTSSNGRPSGPDNQARNLFFGTLLVAAGFLWLLRDFHVVPYWLFNTIFSWQMLLAVTGAYTCSPSGAGSWDGSCWPQASAWSSST